MLRYILLIAVMLALCSTVWGSTTEWQWSFGQGPFFARFGTSISALDDADASDVLIGNSQYTYCGIYQEYGVNDWTGDTGFYSTEIRAPLQLVPGQSETWTFYFWTDPSRPQGPPGDHLEMSWGWNQHSPALSTMQYVLTYAASAQGVTEGSLAVGTSVILNQHQQGTWSFPVYRSTNGRTGYQFNLTATVVPEPSSLLALLAGLGGFGVMLRRRR